MIRRAFEQRTVYIAPMSRISSVSSIVLLSLLPAMAFAATAHTQHARRWHGYGFLPGYHQPPNNTVPVYGSHASPDYSAQYWYNGAWYHFGRPGFYHGRYNGGSFGPCWTWTPIGRVWNCG
jgi:hypothetical protein